MGGFIDRIDVGVEVTHPGDRSAQNGSMESKAADEEGKSLRHVHGAEQKIIKSHRAGTIGCQIVLLLHLSFFKKNTNFKNKFKY